MKVKICGITNVEDGLAAARAGADYLGFIFYARSPRCVTVAQAQAVMAAVRRQASGHSPQGVGVFVNATPSTVQHTLYNAGLAYAQLHGDEGPADVAAQRGRAYKALRPATLEEGLAGVARFGGLGAEGGPGLLVDAFHPATYGGAGQQGDWGLAEALARCTPRLLLAGGLTPDNVVAAIGAVRPWGVDVSSGVEMSPGRKDHELVAAFVAAALSERRP
jgi:phosphoribosylanthranilate isomerase